MANKFSQLFQVFTDFSRSGHPVLLCKPPSTTQPYTSMYTSNEHENWLQHIVSLSHPLSKAYCFINKSRKTTLYCILFNSYCLFSFYLIHIHLSFSLSACKCDTLPKITSYWPNNQTTCGYQWSPQHTLHSTTFLEHQLTLERHACVLSWGLEVPNTCAFTEFQYSLSHVHLVQMYKLCGKEIMLKDQLLSYMYVNM